MKLDKRAIGNALKMERIRQNKTIESIAQSVHRDGKSVSHMTISRLERGVGKMDLELVEAYAGVLGIEAPYHLRRHTTKPEQSPPGTEPWMSPEWQKHRRVTKVIEQVLFLYKRSGCESPEFLHLEDILDRVVRWRDENWERVYRHNVDRAK